VDVKDAVMQDMPAQVTNSEKLKLVDSDADSEAIQSQLSLQQVADALLQNHFYVNLYSVFVTLSVCMSQ